MLGARESICISNFNLFKLNVTVCLFRIDYKMVFTLNLNIYLFYSIFHCSKALQVQTRRAALAGKKTCSSKNVLVHMFLTTFNLFFFGGGGGSYSTF